MQPGVSPSHPKKRRKETNVQMTAEMLTNTRPPTKWKGYNNDNTESLVGYSNKIICMTKRSTMMEMVRA